MAIASVKVGSLKLSQMGVGTWSWGNRLLWNYSEEDDAEIARTYDYVTSRGVNWFDTADSYGTADLEGQSETLLGRFSTSSKKSLNRGKNIYFATKLAPFPWRIGKESMLKACDKSSARLRRDVDVLQLHWPPVFGWQEQNYLDAFSALCHDGKVTQLGVSNYGPEMLKKVAGYTLSTHGIPICSNQVQFSLLSRVPLESGLIDVCRDIGVQPIAYSPLALGLLTDKYTVDHAPTGLRGALFREYLPSLAPLLGELRSIAEHRGKTVAQVALNWPIQKGAIVLVGMRSVQQAKDNLGALGWKLSSAEMAALDAAAAKAKPIVQNNFQSR